MPQRVEDYALIGDLQTAALVSREASIDWLCFPRFDSGACFAALLGENRHGHWRIAPAGDVRAVRRRYRPGTLILETEFDTDEGTVRIVDCMPPRESAPDLARLVEGVRGRVPLRVELVIRFDYGWVVRLGSADASSGCTPSPDLMRCGCAAMSRCAVRICARSRSSPLPPAMSSASC